jgi:hypothetical protein
MPIVQQASWDAGPICKGMMTWKLLALIGVQTPNRPARSKSLNPLHYPDPYFEFKLLQVFLA